MAHQIITDNKGEMLEIKSDGERYALVRHDQVTGATRVAILNPSEAVQMATFIFTEEKEGLNGRRNQNL